jgi:hypothetical protein
METNRDWKAPLALILAGLALFIAIAGRPGHQSVVAWPAFRVEKDISQFGVDPEVPAVPEMPIPEIQPVPPMPEMKLPNKWLNPEAKPTVPRPDRMSPARPDIEMRIIEGYSEPPWSGPGEYWWSLYTRWIAPLSQLVQPLILLLLAWLVIRQFQRRPAAATTRDDITTPEGQQQNGG